MASIQSVASSCSPSQRPPRSSSRPKRAKSRVVMFMPRPPNQQPLPSRTNSSEVMPMGSSRRSCMNASCSGHPPRASAASRASMAVSGVE